jgi:hypothetical protein
VTIEGGNGDIILGLVDSLRGVKKIVESRDGTQTRFYSTRSEKWEIIVREFQCISPLGLARMRGLGNLGGWNPLAGKAACSDTYLGH